MCWPSKWLILRIAAYYYRISNGSVERARPLGIARYGAEGRSPQGPKCCSDCRMSTRRSPKAIPANAARVTGHSAGMWCVCACKISETYMLNSNNYICNNNYFSFHNWLFLKCETEERLKAKIEHAHPKVNCLSTKSSIGLIFFLHHW